MEYHITADTPIGEIMHEDSSDEFVLSADITLDELKHHGIKGMKWGIRRYQKRDGSLTAAGKKRRAKLEAELDKLKDPNEKPRPKTIAEMTDDELRSSINRMSLEKQYKEYDAILHPAQVKQVNKHLDTFKTRLVEGAAEGSKKLLNEFISKKGADLLGISDKKVQSALEKAKEKYEIEKYKHDYDELVNGKKPSARDKAKEEYEELDYKQKAKAIREGKTETTLDQLKNQVDELKYRQQIDEMLRGDSGSGKDNQISEMSKVAEALSKIDKNRDLLTDYGVDVDDLLKNK